MFFCRHIAVFTLLVVATWGNMYGQKVQTAMFNELYTIYKNHPNDTTGINALLKLTSEVCLKCDDSIQTAIRYPMEAYRKSMKINYKKGIVLSNIYIGNILSLLKEESKAIEYYFSAINNSKGATVPEIRTAYQGLGTIYLVQEKYNDAIHFFELADSINTHVSKEANYNTSSYLQGYCLNELKKFDKALIKLSDALSMAEKTNSRQRITEIRISMGNALAGLGLYDSAIAVFKKESKYLLDNKVYAGLVMTHLGLARIYRDKKDLKNALDYAQKAHEFNNLIRDNFMRRESSLLLSQLYFQSGDYKNAYDLLQEHLSAKDSINRKEILSKLAVTEARMNFQKIEDKMSEEIAVGKQKRLRLNLMLGFSALFIVIISVALFSVRKERRKSESLLLNILPVETAKELKIHGHAIPKLHEGVSIIFCDFVNFTNSVETLPPSQLVELLDYYFTGLDEIITRFGIEKIKTIGDAYMCVCGLTPEKNHAETAVAASIEILRFMEKSKQHLPSKNLQPFDIRIGIHSGSVVSGVVGKKKYAYDVWGDDVNIAARMEQKSEPGRINVSESTWEMIKDIYQTESRGKIQAKNKGHLEMYFIIHNSGTGRA